MKEKDLGSRVLLSINERFNMTRREGKGKKEGEKKSMQLIEINGKMRNSVRTSRPRNLYEKHTLHASLDFHAIN